MDQNPGAKIDKSAAVRFAQEIKEVFERYPLLRVQPSSFSEISIVGCIEFRAQFNDNEALDGAFEVEISIPLQFPNRLPEVREIAGVVPKSFHTNPDGTLCLGAPLKLKILTGHRCSVLQYIEKCVIPFFYGFLYHTKHKVMPLGELNHGAQGLLDEYRSIFRVADNDAVLSFLRALSTKKRVANKMPCPCGSAIRLGKCHARSLIRFRKLGARRWYRKQLDDISRELRIKG